MLNILWLPSLFPSNENPVKAIFLKEQASVLADSDDLSITVSYPIMKHLSNASLLELLFPNEKIADNETGPIRLINYFGIRWVVRPFSTPMSNFSRITAKLFGYYTARYGKPDLIHVHFTKWAGYAAYTLHRKYGIPYIITEHSSEFPRGLISARQELILQKVFDGAERIIAVSRALKNSILQRFSISAVDVVHNMVDTDYFTPLFGASNTNDYTVLHIGTHSGNKNIDRIILAFIRAFADIPSAKMIIGGEGNKTAELKTLVHNNHAEDRIIFPGRLTRAEVHDLLQQSDLYVQASDYETFSIITAEAISCGLPVVSTKSGGPEEYISDFGILTNSKQVSDLSAAMRTIYNRKEKYLTDEYKIKSHEHLESLFGKSTFRKKMKDIYDEVIMSLSRNNPV